MEEYIVDRLEFYVVTKVGNNDGNTPDEKPPNPKCAKQKWINASFDVSSDLRPHGSSLI